MKQPELYHRMKEDEPTWFERFIDIVSIIVAVAIIVFVGMAL